MLKTRKCNGAPNAQIVMLIPFGQYCAIRLKVKVEGMQKAKIADSKITIVDLGKNVALSLTQKADNPKDRSFGDLHPNDRGAANFAAILIPQVLNIINNKGK